MNFQALAVLVLHLGVAHAAALSSTVASLEPEAPVVVTPLATGATPGERYRAARPGSALPAGRDAVLLIRGEQRNSPDQVRVVSAERDGGHIRVTYEVRAYAGVLHANVVTQPLIEVSLGALDAGRYTVDVRELRREFTVLGHPERAGTTHDGEQAGFHFDVQ